MTKILFLAVLCVGTVASFSNHGSSQASRQERIVCRQQQQQPLCSTNDNNTSNSGVMDSEIDRGLAKARAVLEKSKAKLAERERAASSTQTTAAAAAASPTPAVPFFAQSTVSRDGVVKSVNQETGLVTADGERMAQISEGEDWIARPLDDVFENELLDDNGDVYSAGSKGLADRDVAASIFNLRKQLQMNDYKRIFDTKNFFIGEDT